MSDPIADPIDAANALLAKVAADLERLGPDIAAAMRKDGGR